MSNISFYLKHNINIEVNMFLGNEILVATNETYFLFIQTYTPTPCNIITQSIMISSHNFQCKNNSHHQPYTPKKNSFVSLSIHQFLSFNVWPTSSKTFPCNLIINFIQLIIILPTIVDPLHLQMFGSKNPNSYLNS